MLISNKFVFTFLVVLMYDLNSSGSELLVWYGPEYAKELGLQTDDDKEKSWKELERKTDEKGLEESLKEIAFDTEDCVEKKMISKDQVCKLKETSLKDFRLKTDHIKEQTSSRNEILTGNLLIRYN